MEATAVIAPATNGDDVQIDEYPAVVAELASSGSENVERAVKGQVAELSVDGDAISQLALRRPESPTQLRRPVLVSA